MKTKYPIVFVHGIAIKDIKFVKSFGQIDRILRIEGFHVYKSNVDGFGTIESNAEILKREIEEIMKKERCEKVNLIAHSKGGLDAKYMIERLDMEDHVASLTTLCTPHKGSVIATKLLSLPKPILSFVAFWINFWYRLFGDKKPNAMEVCRQLALVDTIEEKTVHFSERVYCQSFSTKMEKSTDDFVMGIPLMFSHYFDHRETDGLVSTSSAMFGKYRGVCIEESYSHSEIIDFMVKKSKRDKIYAFYSSLCEELKDLGF